MMPSVKDNTPQSQGGVTHRSVLSEHKIRDCRNPPISRRFQFPALLALLCFCQNIRRTAYLGKTLDPVKGELDIATKNVGYSLRILCRT